MGTHLNAIIAHYIFPSFFEGPSTAFGSTSSGLYSDADDSKNTDEILEGGLAIDPETWLKNPGGATNLQDLLGLKHEDSTDESGKESDETIEGSGDRTTICIGDKEKEVAHSKLSALISLLEKDREFSSNSNSRRYVTISRIFFFQNPNTIAIIL